MNFSISLCPLVILNPVYLSDMIECHKFHATTTNVIIGSKIGGHLSQCTTICDPNFNLAIPEKKNLACEEQKEIAGPERPFARSVVPALNVSNILLIQKI